MRKSALFMKHLPYIENKIEEGYKLDEVVLLLKLEHGFDMKSSSNLSNYLSRFRQKQSEPSNWKPSTRAIAEEAKTEEDIKVKSLDILPQQKEKEYVTTQHNHSNDEVDFDVLKQLEAELITDKARISKPKSIFRSDSKSQDDDENVSPEVLAELKAKLQKTKTSLASKSLFDDRI